MQRILQGSMKQAHARSYATQLLFTPALKSAVGKTFHPGRRQTLFSTSTAPRRAAKPYKSDDALVETDELLSENNPWSPTFEDDPIWIQERDKIRKTKLADKYRLSYRPLYEAPASKYVSLLKRLTLSFGVVGAYGAKLIYQSAQFDDSLAYTLLAGVIIPIVVVQWKTRDYVTRIFRVYDKTKSQSLPNLVAEEQLIAEKLNFTGGRTYNELIQISDSSKELVLSPKQRWFMPYATWEEKGAKKTGGGGGKREFYVMDNIGGTKMDRIWGIVEKNSGVNNGRTFPE
ncbi:uncharacterized protein LODBEIA_P55910 [Lodderomyces beijingensis]|uniref:Uncharacterized protein n=1 Tax=Lodderomyces beijingensis TaxID=1775926 RepID=A0ABP0ZTB8_9ASCO